MYKIIILLISIILFSCSNSDKNKEFYDSKQRIDNSTVDQLYDELNNDIN